MENERILNEIISLEAMALMMLEKCQKLRKELNPDFKKKRKKGGLSEDQLLRMRQHTNAVWIKRGIREEAKRKQDEEAAKGVNKTVNNLLKKGEKR